MARTAGSLNRSTEQVRRAVSELLQQTAPKMQEWLQKVANGIPEMSVEDPSKQIGWVNKPDPKGAVDLVLKAAEYHIPKLARTESHVTDGPEQSHEDWLRGLE